MNPGGRVHVLLTIRSRRRTLARSTGPRIRRLRLITDEWGVVRPAEALARTRLPYVPGRRMRRTWLLIAGVAVVAVGLDLVRAIVLDTPYVAMTSPALFLCVGIRRGSPAPVIGPDRVVLGRWPRRRTVPWADVASVRLSAGPDTITLRDTAGRVVSQRIPRREDLADLEAILSAYAPPPTLGHPLVH